MRPRVVRIDTTIEWYSKFDAEASQWLAVCPSLNLSAWGETYAEMVECAHEATGLLWEDLLEEGDFDQFLRERGWNAGQGYSPQDGEAPKARIDVPYTMNPTDKSLMDLMA